MLTCFEVHIVLESNDLKKTFKEKGFLKSLLIPQFLLIIKVNFLILIDRQIF